MKKLISITLSVLMLLVCMATVVSAEDAVGSESGDVVITIDKATVIYQVNIAWGNLTWNYDHGEWSVKDHQYNGSGLYTGEGEPAESVTSSLTVENDSNAEVQVTVAFKDTAGEITATNNGITAALSSDTIPNFDGTFTLESAENYMNSEDGDSETVLVTVTVDERPSGNRVVVGTITVTINKVVTP